MTTTTRTPIYEYELYHGDDIQGGGRARNLRALRREARKAVRESKPYEKGVPFSARLYVKYEIPSPA